jgi:hypothetical protein
MSGSNTPANSNILELFDDMIAKENNQFHSKDIAKKLCGMSRRYSVSPYRVGSLLKQRSDIKSIGKGMWEKI